MLKKFLMASCALMIACSPSLAADKKAVQIGSVDANKDGKVSTAEATGAGEKQFTNLDGNKDGKVTKTEFLTSGKSVLTKLPADFVKKNKDRIVKSQEKRFAMLDTNKDGNITKDEMLADMTARHKKMDANGDGDVTKEELTAFHKSAAPKKSTAK